MATAIVIAFLAIIFRYLRGVRPISTRRTFTSDLLNGAVVYPFVLLVASAFSSKLLHQLDDARISVSLAGGVGLAFVVGELLSSCGAARSS